MQNNKNQGQTNRAVIYSRVSSYEQVVDGNSLVSQERICREYAMRKGYEVAAIFVEKGESAKTANRTELTKLLAYCKERKNGISKVIAYKVDRIARNDEDYLSIKILLRAYNIKIESATESFDESPSGPLMERMLSSLSQFDNDVRTERCINGMKEAIREGRYIWSAPLGYSNVRIGNKGTIEVNSQATIVLEIFNEVAANQTTIEQVRLDIIRRYKAQLKGLKLSKSYFWRILRNEVYTGWINKFGERTKGCYEPIINEELFNQVQRVIKYSSKQVKRYAIENPDFPLRRFITNEQGVKVTGAWSTGRSKRYAYYYFSKPKLNIKKEYLETAFMEYLDEFRLSNRQCQILKRFIISKFENINGNVHSKEERKQSLLAELKSKQSALVQKNLDGIIQDSLLKEQLEMIDKEMMKIYSTQVYQTVDNPQIGELLNFVEDYLKNPGKVWLNASPELKLKLQWFEFPKGITIHNTGFRTAEMSLLHSTIGLIGSQEFSKVHIRGRTSNHQKTSINDKMDRDWILFSDNIKNLVEILNEIVGKNHSN